MLKQLGILRGWDRTRLGVILGLLLAFFSIASIAKADTAGMYFIGATGSVTLNVSDATAGYTNANAVIDPYMAYINGSSAPTIIWCVDPDHEVSPGDSWTAYVSYPTNVSQTYLGNATTYEEMAWLATQLQAATATATKQELQAAIWDVAEGATTSNSDSTGGDFSVNGMSTTFYSAVATDITSAEGSPLTSGFEILTDKAGAKQEFIVLTPEPSAILLLLAGLFALIILSRSKMARPLLG